jgi:REP element-mobilizing transposase RayT
MTSQEWDDSSFPLAYLITIRTFGTWLHGDDRGSMDRHGKNIYGTPRIPRNAKLHFQMSREQTTAPFLLDGPQRGCVEAAIRSMCQTRGYTLSAINVRTNHAHAVISASVKPEVIINALKANATRELRQNGLVGADTPVWSRGGSRRYLWKPHHVDAAIEYVLHGQGPDLPKF